jgi:hypothetical protein
MAKQHSHGSSGSLFSRHGSVRFLVILQAENARFESREDMWNATAQLNTIPKDAFQKYFQQWQDCWDKCVHYQGDYFEVD